MARRKYGSYEEYVTHQASKLDKILDRLQDSLEEDYEEFVRRFEGASRCEARETCFAWAHV